MLVGSSSGRGSRGSLCSSSTCVDSTGTSRSQSGAAATGSPKPPEQPGASLCGARRGAHDTFISKIYIFFSTVLSYSYKRDLHIKLKLVCSPELQIQLSTDYVDIGFFIILNWNRTIEILFWLDFLLEQKTLRECYANGSLENRQTGSISNSLWLD